MHIFISIMSISSPNPMFDHLLESPHRDDSNKWSNIEFGEKITQGESIEINFTHLNWSAEPNVYFGIETFTCIYLNQIEGLMDL